MKIVILGSGSLGSAIGGMLSLGGSDVCFVDRWQTHIDAINSNGLKLCENGTEKVIRAKAQTDCSGLGTADLVIVLVKSFNTKNALLEAKEIIGENTAVMSLQNGLGNEEDIAAILGAVRVISGKTYIGSVLKAPGVAEVGIKGKKTFIGELNGAITSRIQEIGLEFQKAGLETEVSHNITGLIWDKLLINVATGALSAVTRLSYGSLYQISEIKDCGIAAVKEGIELAKALEIELSEYDAEKIWNKASAGLSPDFKTSMLQSVEKGDRTEIDFINGSIVRFAGKLGLGASVNATLVACVKGIERWNRECGEMGQ